MSKILKPSFVVRKYESKDCEEVVNIWTKVSFSVAKYEVVAKVMPGTFVAQDLQTGTQCIVSCCMY